MITRVCLLATLAFAAVLAYPQTAPTAFPPGSTPYDKSYGEWSASWWKWVMAIPYDVNPMLDTTGASASIDQRGPVWFLAGTSGFQGPVTRSVTVPAGKALLFPLMNYLNDYDRFNPENPYGPGPLPKGVSMHDWLLPFAQFVIDGTVMLNLEVDGISIDPWPFRAVSDVFTFKADPTMVNADPVVNPEGRPQPGISDGYWVMLQPLSVGPHTIHWASQADLVFDWGTVTFSNDVTVLLTVAPKK